MRLATGSGSRRPTPTPPTWSRGGRRASAAPGEAPSTSTSGAAKVEIAQVSPGSLLLAEAPQSGSGALPTTAHSLQIVHKIEPEEWRKLLDPWLVLFTLKDAEGAIAAGAQGGEGFASSDRFSIPRGVSLARGDYTANLEVQSVARSSIGAAGAGSRASPSRSRRAA